MAYIMFKCFIQKDIFLQKHQEALVIIQLNVQYLYSDALVEVSDAQLLAQLQAVVGSLWLQSELYFVLLLGIECW